MFKQNKTTYRFSKEQIAQARRLFESEEQVKEEPKKETQISKDKVLKLIQDGTAYFNFNNIPSDKRRAVLDAFKKAGLKLQNTGIKLVAMMKPTTDALGAAYAKNSEKVNMLLGLGMAAGILSNFGVNFDTVCASAAVAMTPEMLKMLYDVYMMDTDEDEDED